QPRERAKKRRARPIGRARQIPGRGPYIAIESPVTPAVVSIIMVSVVIGAGAGSMAGAGCSTTGSSMMAGSCSSPPQAASRPATAKAAKARFLNIVVSILVGFGSSDALPGGGWSLPPAGALRYGTRSVRGGADGAHGAGVHHDRSLHHSRVDLRLLCRRLHHGLLHDLRLL